MNMIKLIPALSVSILVACNGGGGGNGSGTSIPTPEFSKCRTIAILDNGDFDTSRISGCFDFSDESRGVASLCSNTGIYQAAASQACGSHSLTCVHGTTLREHAEKVLRELGDQCTEVISVQVAVADKDGRPVFSRGAVLAMSSWLQAQRFDAVSIAWSWPATATGWLCQDQEFADAIAGLVGSGTSVYALADHNDGTAAPPWSCIPGVTTVSSLKDSQAAWVLDSPDNSRSTIEAAILDL